MTPGARVAKAVRAAGSLIVLTLAFGLGTQDVQAHGEATHGAHGTAEKKVQKPWGIAGEAHDAKRTIEIRMIDTMRFVPDQIEVRKGETVRLVLHNAGKTMHELVIGTKQTLDEHAASMTKFPDMEHDEPYMAHVAPGHSGEIIWTFNKVGEFGFACLIAGHYQAGMIGKVRVTAKR